MTTDVFAAIAIGMTLPPLLVLALRDPKRLRSHRAAQRGAKPGERRALALASLLPGLVLAALGAWPAFLIWLGGIATGGWLIVLWLARSGDNGATPS
ncbi:hypothetical protein [Sinimarinibacterium thermocellulolyticum]|uniref:DUF3325 domain-containing protein n=1 Tax=Sinimarinibacterium thermocellulolyticum TaxID=3170016 RepID=A0ABV2A951_9GAMM